MKFWQILQQIKNKSHSSWLGVALVIGVIVSLSIGQLGRMHVTSVVIYPHDVFIIAWLITEATTVLSLFFTLRSINYKHYLAEYLLVGWVLLGLVLEYITSNDALPWLYTLRLTIYLLFLVTVYRKFGKFPLLLRCTAMIIGSVMVMFGFIQYFLFPDTRYLFNYGWDDHYYRLIGTLLDPNYTGLIIILTGWATFSFRKYMSKTLIAQTIIVLLVGVALTFSRASYLSLIVSIIGFIVTQSIKIKRISKITMISIVAIVSVICAAVLLAPKPGGEGVDLLRTASITARYTVSAEFLTILTPLQWITGAGLYTRPVEIHDVGSHARVPDNVLVLLLYSTGAIGFVLALLSGIKLSKHIVTKNEVLLPVTIAIFTHAQFNNSLLEPFTLLIGGILVLALLKDTE